MSGGDSTAEDAEDAEVRRGFDCGPRSRCVLCASAVSPPFCGNTSSRSLVRKSVGSFRENAAFPSEGIAAPGGLTGIGWSDQWSFWEEGYPAVMITDTAIFRYKQYHRLSDTPDKIDYDRMVRVVAGVSRVVSELVETKEGK